MEANNYYYWQIKQKACQKLQWNFENINYYDYNQAMTNESNFGIK